MKEEKSLSQIAQKTSSRAEQLKQMKLRLEMRRVLDVYEREEREIIAEELRNVKQFLRNLDE